MQSWHIHIEGQVQGVGFRPFVFRLAGEYGLGGWVNNASDGVHIRITAGERTARRFLKECLQNPPKLARISRHSIREVPLEDHKVFRIVHSRTGGAPNLLLSPDFGLCSDCRAELLQPGNRRHQYPFITCTLCGPRYSIVRDLPYDRERTTMEPFVQCPSCLAEYRQPADRRYFSQTNSCPVCGIGLWYEAGKKVQASGEHAWRKTIEDWRLGKIVAIKGIGGYLLTCDATRSEVIDRLRKGKGRPTKPFALLYPDAKTLALDVRLEEESRKLLQSERAPIGIFPLKNDHPVSGISLQEIAPGLDQIGAMLPYTPLYELLLRAFGRPVVATSGNITGMPIVFEDDKARQSLGRLADGFLMHDREVLVPQDDSVWRFTPRHHYPIFIRRSRGYAPSLFVPTVNWPEETVLCCGGELKSTFLLLHRQNLYLSQYLGKLDQYDTQLHYRKTMDHLLGMLKARPERILVDAHPEYAATRRGEEMARELDVPLERVQHHEAHFAALLGEHELFDSRDPILGVIWDGTGYGSDGQVWGGEFFLYEEGCFRRLTHLPYFPFILGDKMVNEPRISALALFHGFPEAEDRLRSKFTDTEWRLYGALCRQAGILRCSSMGRLFDGLSSLLGFLDRATYEGEAAVLLETAARTYLEDGGMVEPYPLPGEEPFPLVELQRAILRDLSDGVPAGKISARFHLSLAEWPGRMARKLGIRKVAFSGGVFQNALLVDALMDKWSGELDLYFHQQLAPNDENISFGQLALWTLRRRNGL